MTKTFTLNSCNVTASHFQTLMHQMSQKIFSAPEKYVCKAKLSQRQNKGKGNFQEELLDFQWEQMVLQ